jgi:hypothetical protein
MPRTSNSTARQDHRRFGSPLRLVSSRVLSPPGSPKEPGFDAAALWGPKTCVTWPDAPLTVGCSARAACRGVDDLRLVGSKLIFLIVIRAVSVLGLARREWWWKDAEILMLRHQLAVAERDHPRAHSRLTWPDRAWLALLAGTVPAERLAAMRLIVAPGTILCWQRDIVSRRWSRRGRSGRPATIDVRLTGAGYTDELIEIAGQLGVRVIEGPAELPRARPVQFIGGCRRAASLRLTV